MGTLFALIFYPYVSFQMFGKYKVDDLCFRPKYEHPTVSKKY
jgi:hypothetical protein